MLIILQGRLIIKCTYLSWLNICLNICHLLIEICTGIYFNFYIDRIFNQCFERHCYNTDIIVTGTIPSSPISFK